ncbi:MAG: hypothetical protein WBV37_06400 [Nocardioidaceae bacterium]
MFDIDLSALDEMATLAHVEQVRALAEQTEVRLLQTAAHWADLHSELARPTSPLLPGSEKLVCFRWGRDPCAGGVRTGRARCGVGDLVVGCGAARRGRVGPAAPAPAPVGSDRGW